MLRRNKLYLVALVILASLLAGLITYRHLPAQEKLLAGARQQNAEVMPLVSNSSLPTEAQEQTRSRIEVGYGNLPLSFEPNHGQTDPRVKFVSRAGNRTLWLTSDEAVLAVGRPPHSIGPDTKQAAAAKENQSAPAILRMKFVGANAHPRIAGEAKQSGTVNYFAGKPNEWRTKIPVYSRVRYRNLYAGIDLVFYGNNRELEYDLVVAPGADHGRIKLAVTGADQIRIDDQGNLVLSTSQGEVVQQKPKIYQRNGTALTAVAGEYVITGKDEIGFRLGNYDRHAAVVIDPVLRYSTLLGGSDLDRGNAIAVDSSNRAVVVGTTCSQNFPAKGSGTPPTPRLCSAFITKFDFTGSHLVFSTFLGDGDGGTGVALDSFSNIYVIGQTFSFGRFPTTAGAFQTTFGGSSDAFVTKLNASGRALLYSTFLGGSGADAGGSIAVDSEGNAYVTGTTESSNFPTTAGVFQHDCTLQLNGSCQSAFVTKLNASGSRALYSTYLGGHGTQQASGIDVNGSGNAFVTGGTTAIDFPTTAGTAQPVLLGAADAFVSQLSSSGSHLIYSTFLGGSSDDSASSIALDSLGNAFVVGSTSSNDFPVKNAFQPLCALTFRVCFSGFVTKLNSSGLLVYSTFLGGGVDGPDAGSGIAVTPGGQAYVTGSTRSSHFPVTQNAFQRVPGSENDLYITKFSPAGHLIYSSYLGGSGVDLAPAVALDPDTNAYVTGVPGAGFPVTPGAFQQKFGGGESDAFVAKVVALCALSPVNRSVTICTPSSGSTVKSPVNIVAGTTDVTPVKLTQVYLDGQKIYETPLSAINVNLPIAGGTHRLTVQGLDTANVFFKKSISINVGPR